MVWGSGMEWKGKARLGGMLWISIERETGRDGIDVGVEVGQGGRRIWVTETLRNNTLPVNCLLLFALHAAVSPMSCLPTAIMRLHQDRI